MTPEADAVLDHFKRNFISSTGAVNTAGRLQAIARALGSHMNLDHVHAGVTELVAAGYLKWSEDGMGAILTDEGKRKIGKAP